VHFNKNRWNGEWFRIDPWMLNELNDIEICNSKISESFNFSNEIKTNWCYESDIKHLKTLLKNSRETINDLKYRLERADQEIQRSFRTP
jgi:hypothetical protein